MPDYRRQTCRGCGGHSSEVGPISWGGLCLDCGKANVKTAIDEMAAHSGPTFARWRAGVILAAGGSLPEKLSARLDAERGSGNTPPADA